MSGFQRRDRTDRDLHRPGHVDDGGGGRGSRGNTRMYHQHAPEPDQYGTNSGKTFGKKNTKFLVINSLTFEQLSFLVLRRKGSYTRRDGQNTQTDSSHIHLRIQC